MDVVELMIESKPKSSEVHEFDQQMIIIKE